MTSPFSSVFSSFLWSSQIVSHVQTKLKVGAFVAWTRIALCFGQKVCKPRSPPHPPFWTVRFPVWYARNRSDTLGKYQTGNRAIWLVDFQYQPSQELSRVIIKAYRPRGHKWLVVGVLHFADARSIYCPRWQRFQEGAFHWRQSSHCGFRHRCLYCTIHAWRCMEQVQ